MASEPAADRGYIQLDDWDWSSGYLATLRQRIERGMQMTDKAPDKTTDKAPEHATPPDVEATPDDGPVAPDTSDQDDIRRTWRGDPADI